MTRLTVLKRAAFVTLLLGTLLGGLLALVVASRGLERASRASSQASALNLARRPEAAPPLRWLPAPPGAPRPDGVTLEDLRTAYLLGHSELTYAARSGDPSGLSGRLAGNALSGALAVTRQERHPLLLDWNHRARLLGPDPAGGWQLRVRYWTARALPGPDGWTDLRVTRRDAQVTLREQSGVWRTTDVTLLADTRPDLRAPPALPVRSWRAVTLPADWTDWTPARWQRTLTLAARHDLRPLVLPLPAQPTREQLGALRAALTRLHAAARPAALAFSAPLTLESVPVRAAVAEHAALAAALLTGPVRADDPGSRAALLALRLTHPDLPLLAPVDGPAADLPDLPALNALLSAQLRAPTPGPAAPQVLLTAPPPPRLPLPGRPDRRGPALTLAAWQGGWLLPLDALFGPDDRPTPDAALLLETGR
ncbi:hypothetical protein [Deinococcus indicus]|uniref:hypothetical protein n=1 Tax=Deinococcus indicus TaxID=223556 RepID=UPI00174CF2DA|nr:hypothetical protein [Deinococcus indicus]